MICRKYKYVITQVDNWVKPAITKYAHSGIYKTRSWKPKSEIEIYGLIKENVNIVGHIYHKMNPMVKYSLITISNLKTDEVLISGKIPLPNTTAGDFERWLEVKKLPYVDPLHRDILRNYAWEMFYREFW